MTSSSFIPQYSVIPPSPLTLMIGLAASRGNLKQDVLQMATKSPMPPTTSRVQQDLGGKTISTCVPQVHPQHGMSSAQHFVSITSPRVLWCNLTQGRRSVDEFSREFNRLGRYATEEVSTDAKKQE